MTFNETIVAETYEKNAENAMQGGSPDKALQHLLAAATEYNKLLEKDPDNIYYQTKSDQCMANARKLVPQPSLTRSRQPDAKEPVHESNVCHSESSKGHWAEETPKTTFDDVAGFSELKDELISTIMDPIQRPDIYKEVVGNDAFEGIIIYGPPGCGKTYIIESLAGEIQKEIDLTYMYISGSKIKDKWVGESEKKINSVFKYAAQNEPALVFFDELEALGGTRDGRSVHDDNLVAEFLAAFRELQGKHVVVVGATNYPWKLDSALVRSGRFGGETIYFPPPDLEARTGLFKHHLKGKKVDSKLNYDQLAALTDSYTASDIYQIVKKSAKLTLRKCIDKAEPITYADLCEGLLRASPSLTGYVREVSEFNGRLRDYPGLQDLVTKYGK